MEMKPLTPREEKSPVKVISVRFEVFSDSSQTSGRILSLKPNGDYVYGVFGAAPSPGKNE